MSDKKDIHIFVTEKEKEQIEEFAKEKGITTTTYLKNVALNKGINLEVKLNDLVDYTAEIYETNKKIQSILNTINRTNQVYSQDVEKIKELLEEINFINKKTLEDIYENRQQEFKDLKREMKKFLKKQNNKENSKE